MEIKNIDIFCEVIDNYGDIGVAYRLARELNRYYSNKKNIRLIVNSLKELRLMENNSKIEILKYSDIDEKIRVANLVFECFGCKIPEIYMEKAYYNSKILLNLEYFSSEDWIEDFHLQESLLGKGSLKKYFFMPGISKKSGGILIDDEFIERKNKVLKNKDIFLKKYNIKNDYDLIGSIFSYEKNFDDLIMDLQKLDKKVLLLVMSEKTQKNFINYFDNTNKYDKIDFVKLPFYSYDKYEEIISLCDFNFVRGEDSFARALLLGKPFLWHIYPQSEMTHILKLRSFLEKYYSSWDELRNIFLNYNIEQKVDYKYFFENLSKIENYNKEYSEYLQKNCNLIKKLNNFIENLGGIK